jgi:hypothetical protein
MPQTKLDLVNQTTGVLPSASFPTLTGDVSNTALATTVTKVNGTSLAGLATGLLKNTTATGVPSIAVAGTDYATPSAVQQESYTFTATDSGTANAYAVSYTPAPTLVAGSAGSFKAANASTGASTLAVNGGTATAIKQNGNSTALSTGSITAGQIIDWTYDGTVFQIIVAAASTVINFVDNEVVGGTSNGVNATFTLANIPTTGSVSLFLNGVLQQAGSGNDYTISGLTITMLNIPLTGDKLLANYRH